MSTEKLTRELDALEKAIAHYRGETVRKAEGNIVCECFGVTEKEIDDAILDNSLTTLEQVTDYTKAGGGCGDCHHDLQDLLRDTWTLIREEEAKREAPVEAGPVIDLEARQMLEPVCGWFTEGFDTRDLQEGKALLDAVDAVDLIALAFPLYVDTLPAPAIEALPELVGVEAALRQDVGGRKETWNGTDSVRIERIASVCASRRSEAG